VGCQSETTQRLAHHYICLIGLDAEDFSVGPKVLPTSSPPLPIRATSRLRTVKLVGQAHETRRVMSRANKQSVSGIRDVVTAACCCLFVCFFPASPLVGLGGPDGHRTAASTRPPTVEGRRCHGATRRRARRRGPKRARRKKLSKRALVCTAPHYVKCARHGSAEMALCGRQAPSEPHRW
jgi:hypothetical protein